MTKMIASLIAMVSAMASLLVDASIYQHKGGGLCNPESGYEYSYIVIGNIGGAIHCSTKCDAANGSHEDDSLYYRGFSFVQRQAGDLSAHSCLCFYDYHHLPEFSAELEDIWGRHDTGDGEGPVSSSDETEFVGCYEVLISTPVYPQNDVPEVIKRGYDNHRLPNP